jgi:large subunit ribosomal protein L23
MSKQDKSDLIDLDLYDVIRAPLITEKATMASEYNQFSFRVPLKATKPQIKKAIEALFKVNVIGVNTSITQGKFKMFRGKAGVRNNTKKAIVRLAEGQSIDVTTGL